MRADDVVLGFDDTGEFGERDEFAEGSLGDVEGADYAGSGYSCAYVPQLETSILALEIGSLTMIGTNEE